MEVELGLLLVIVLIIATYFVLFTLAVERKWFRWNRHKRLSNVALPGPWRHKSWGMWVLLVTRGISFGYAIGIYFQMLASVDWKPELFIFFTVWNYTMYTIMFGCLFVASLIYLRRHRFKLPSTAKSFYGIGHHVEGESDDVEEEDVDKDGDSSRKMRIFVRVCWVLFEIVSTMVFLVDIVVWTILLPAAEKDGSSSGVLNFSSFNVHASNALFVLVELLLNRFTYVYSHVLFVLGWALLYTMWAWIWYDHSGDWIYFFVNTAQKSAPLWYLLLLVLHTVFFSLVYGLWILKERTLHHRARQQEAREVQHHNYGSLH
eukprot:TRINITY_DN2315_c0_g1_i1.p1 TRINITY_DN2315_c0_g1~~TRINITY_DN2315_c0_g1_i1.p1  ORF type:complete len:317 (+),score=52.72 TRINITY_DN2315_c0_g1_i1:44-994(+)